MNLPESEIQFLKQLASLSPREMKDLLAHIGFQVLQVEADDENEIQNNTNKVRV